VPGFEPGIEGLDPTLSGVQVPKMSENLEPISPEDAIDMYLRERSSEVASSTIQSHEYRLGHLARWCENEGIDNLNDIGGRDLHRYKLWREEDGDLSKASLKTQMDTIRVFISFCESIDAVASGLHEKVLSPTLDPGDNQREVMLEADEAEDLLGYLRRFNYASLDHVVVALLWHTGLRAGAARALDVGDFDADARRLGVRHRPETPLKNKTEGERLIALSPDMCVLLDDWLKHSRPDVVDGQDRKPLLATKQGRPHVSTVRDIIYRWTRPCQYTEECPHGREIEDCEAREHGGASKCPSSVSSHAIRRGAITHFLTEDVPEKVVSDRMNVSREVLADHYDQRSEDVKVEQRRDFIDGV
jgi:integrase